MVWSRPTGDWANQVAPYDDISVIAAGSINKKLQVFFQNGTRRRGYDLQNWPTALAVSGDGSYIGVGCEDGTSYLFSPVLNRGRPAQDRHGQKYHHPSKERDNYEQDSDSQCHHLSKERNPEQHLCSPDGGTYSKKDSDTSTLCSARGPRVHRARIQAPALTGTTPDTTPGSARSRPLDRYAPENTGRFT